MTSFSELALIEPIERALRAENYTIPTPIQAAAIPPLLDGRDLLGCAQTGTGKTAAFALPILQRLANQRRPAPRKGARVLVLAPTRELALQIGESFGTYGRHLGLTRAVVFGGVGQNPQVAALARGIDVLIATPGRLLDLMGQGHAKLSGLEVLVLDEADRMLDMGFIRDIRQIVATLPAQRQTLLFSATMPRDIAALADSMLKNPVKVEVAAPATTVEKVDQWVLFVDRENKRHLLAEMLKDPKMSRTLIFTRTKHGANRVTEQLARIQVRAQAIHGNKSQGARQAALESFRSGQTRVLVATDIAARGIDVDGITHVINFELPNEPESYVHRIGRTARAGARGVALSFCDREERAYLRDIERLTKQPLQVVAEHPFRAAGGAMPASDAGHGSDRPRAPPAHGGGGRSRWRGPARGGRR
ncbi:MAG TPA: DEAD/DEAH box helicase [Polyangia bacterium]|nr:DEAD/DEAH box helicase [Polyangia bacterium]